MSGTRSRGRQSKRWIDNIREDLQQRGSDMQQAAECVKDRKQWKNLVHAAHRQQPAGEDGRVKEIKEK